MLANHALPLCHLDRMHLVVSCNLSNRLDPHQGFQSYFGLEGACIPFPFSFTHSSAVFSCPAEPEKSNLASGPNFGVHFWCQPSVASISLAVPWRWLRGFFAISHKPLSYKQNRIFVLMHDDKITEEPLPFRSDRKSTRLNSSHA